MESRRKKAKAKLERKGKKRNEKEIKIKEMEEEKKKERVVGERREKVFERDNGDRKKERKDTARAEWRYK